MYKVKMKMKMRVKNRTTHCLKKKKKKKMKMKKQMKMKMSEESDYPLLEGEDEEEEADECEESCYPLPEEADEDEDEDESEESDNPLPEEEDDCGSTSIGFSGEMAWLSDDFNKIKDQLFQPIRPFEFAVLSIVGVAGSGRTLIARDIFEEFHTLTDRPCCGAWVTIGPKSQFKEIQLLSILDQVVDQGSTGKRDHYELLISEGDEKLGEYLYSCLKGRTYVIVLDDIWDTQIWDYLRRWFPQEDNNGSLVLLTTGLKEVAQSANSSYIHEMSQLVDRNGLCQILYGAMYLGQPCPPGLEEVEKVFENCQDLFLVFLKVMVFMCKAWNKPEEWEKLAANKEDPIFTVVDERSEMRKIKEDLEFYISLPDVDGRSIISNLANVYTEVSPLSYLIAMQTFQRERSFSNIETILLHGMAGIGKTTFAKKLFEDPLIVHHFDHRAWVTLGQKYKTKEILVDILAQIYPGIHKRQIKTDAKLAKDLCAQLSYKRYLIVLDDAWNIDVLAYLANLVEFLPDIRCKALVISRQLIREVDFDMVHEMRLLNEEESWYFFCQKMFAEGLCYDLELEKVGRKIAKECDGLPLTIVKVAKLLSKAEKTPEYWNKVAEKQDPCFNDVYSEISKVLYPSYKILNPCLKKCFLYMGVFCQNYNILTSKLINLWVSEEFFDQETDLYLEKTAEDNAAKCLWDLVNRSLVMVCQKGLSSEIKTCRLHSTFWYLANIEAARGKFFHAFNTYTDISTEATNNQRILCIRNSSLLGITDVQNTIASISSACSLLCTGPPHRYPMPINFDLRLLKVMDALPIRLYEFPIFVVELIRLKYLALTCNGKLPASISELWNLQFLIINQHLSINLFGDSSYLPMEIWNMKELKHLQIKGSNLPNPDCCTILENLSTLKDVSAQSCTEEVLKGIPNLKKLGIQIELSPDDDGISFHCLNHISCLTRLESLKCVVVNPHELKAEVVAPPARVLMFSSSLKKLSLSGLGYPWKYMKEIAELPRLEVLKLRCYAFRGPEWEIDYAAFDELRYLLIEDTDLVRFEFKFGNFPKLKCLSIKHCYKLEELPSFLSWNIESITLIDCNPLAMTWAKQMKEKGLKNSICLDEDDENGLKNPLKSVKVQVHSSWN